MTPPDSRNRVASSASAGFAICHLPFAIAKRVLAKNHAVLAGAASLLLLATAEVSAQQVCLPSPRLLTVLPMGAQSGHTVDVTVTGESADEATELLFSNPKITAKPKTAPDGKPLPNQFTVTVAPDAPAGVVEARLMTRLGVSSSRAFSVGILPEVTRTAANNSLETALPLPTNTVCNAAMTKRAVDFYAFEGKKGQRVIVDCAAAGIDSKLVAVLIVTDAQGRDLVVNRTGGVVEFTPPADARYFVKVHSLTFQGGPEHFYRLAIFDAAGDGPVPRLPSTQTVSAFSWTPDSTLPQIDEAKKDASHPGAQKVALPCQIAGRFYPAADVDTYEFSAKKGETWWVEVASERLGLPTDPFVVVQKVNNENGVEKLTDVVELNDIPSPMKVSTNGYSYDGPPYDAGSADPMGKVEIKEDGVYRLQIRDLFGGTRTDPSHVYQLAIRKAAPDYALAGWALHMTLRNGDRNALSKPIALRDGATIAFEVVVVRKDGFDGEIELSMEDLPQGVTACGLKIPAGKSKGIMLITAAEDAPRALALAKIVGKAQINGVTVSHLCRVASMTWPVRDATQEIPKPRLLVDVPVSVGDAEYAPVSIAARESKTWEAKAGDKLTIPLKMTWRSEFAGTSIKMKALGEGFEAAKEIDVPMKADGCEAVLDLAALKTPPGEYTLAFYGPAVTKYRDNLQAVKLAELEEKKAAEQAQALTDAAKKLAEEAKSAPAEKKPEMDGAAKAAADKMKSAEAAKADASKRMKAATDNAAPKDTADIVVSEPVRIIVKPADPKG